VTVDQRGDEVTGGTASAPEAPQPVTTADDVPETPPRAVPQDTASSLAGVLISADRYDLADTT